MTTYGITQPAVGDKITAAGFGKQIKDSLDIHDLLIWAAAGREPSTPTTSAATTATVGTSTVVASPGSGRRVLKSLLVHAPSAGAGVTLTVAGTNVAVLDFSAAGLFAADVVVPIASSETIAVTVTGSTVYVTAAYADRTDALLDRLGIVSTTSASPQTLVTSSASARILTELWIAAPDAAGTTATVKVGSNYVTNALAVPSHGLLVLDEPIPVPASTTVTVAADGTHTLAVMAIGH